MGNEVFPLRIKLKPVKIFEKPVDFKSLIPKLSSSRTSRSGQAILWEKPCERFPRRIINSSSVRANALQL